jgi:hypothetical protein
MMEWIKAGEARFERFVNGMEELRLPLFKH